MDGAHDDPPGTISRSGQMELHVDQRFGGCRWSVRVALVLLLVVLGEGGIAGVAWVGRRLGNRICFAATVGHRAMLRSSGALRWNTQRSIEKCAL